MAHVSRLSWHPQGIAEGGHLIQLFLAERGLSKAFQMGFRKAQMGFNNIWLKEVGFFDGKTMTLHYIQPIEEENTKDLLKW